MRRGPRRAARAEGPPGRRVRPETPPRWGSTPESGSPAAAGRSRTVTPTTLGQGVQFRSGQEEAQPAEQAHLTPQEQMADLSDRLFARALRLAAWGGRPPFASVAR